MTPFAKYFKLKDPERTNFLLSTNRVEDLRLYVDLDDMLPTLSSALDEEAPLFLIEGSFGSGKSHLLRYVEYILAPKKATFLPVYVELSGFRRHSDFEQLHQQLMTHLIPLAKEALRVLGGARQEQIRNLKGISELMGRALEGLALPAVAVPNSDATTAETWLRASKLSVRDMKSSGYTASLFEEAGPKGVIQLYKAISELHRRALGKRLLLLLDEGESFSRVVDLDAQAHIGAGMRGFFDSENRDIGLFLGLTTPRARGGVHPMLRSDVASRVGQRKRSLSSLTGENAQRFMVELWGKLTKKQESPPFLLAPEAMQFLTDKIDALRQLVATDELSPTPVPRDYLNVLTHIGQEATRTKLPPPIRVEQIRGWFGI